MRAFFLLLLEFATAITVSVNGKIKPNPHEAPNFVGVEVRMDHDHVGFVSRDGSFSIHNVAVGTYILHVISPKLSYVPIRIDVGNQGSIRARKLNILTLKDVEKIPYPLELEPVAKTPYFAKREQFSIFDQLKNPMVLFMMLPMVLLFLLPKIMDMQDPELKKEMEEQMKSMNKGSQLPDASELMSSFFGGPQNEPKKTSKKKKN